MRLSKAILLILAMIVCFAINATAMHDGLGRRVQTTYQPLNNGVNNGSPVALSLLRITN